MSPDLVYASATDCQAKSVMREKIFTAGGTIQPWQAAGTIDQTGRAGLYCR